MSFWTEKTEFVFSTLLLVSLVFPSCSFLSSLGRKLNNGRGLHLIWFSGWESCYTKHTHTHFRPQAEMIRFHTEVVEWSDLVSINPDQEGSHKSWGWTELPEPQKRSFVSTKLMGNTHTHTHTHTNTLL